MLSNDPGPALIGRRSECEVLDRLLTDVRAHNSRVLVLRGEAGVGKSALMEYVASASAGCRVVRTAGVESEMELPFAGVHQLCAPMLSRIDDPAGTATRPRWARHSDSSLATLPIASSSGSRC